MKVVFVKGQRIKGVFRTREKVWVHVEFREKDFLWKGLKVKYGEVNGQFNRDPY